MKRIVCVIMTIVIITALTVTLFACSTVTFESITGIKSFEDLDKIAIVKHTIVDNVIVGSEVKEYKSEKDLLEIFTLLTGTKFAEDKNLAENEDIPEISIRFYVKGEDGYLEYYWNKKFVKEEGYDKKLKGEYFRVVDAEEVLNALKNKYYAE